MTIIINGKDLAKQEIANLKHFWESKNQADKDSYGDLCIVSVGNDPASAIYVNSKIKVCKEIGIPVSYHWFPEETSSSSIYSFLHDKGDITCRGKILLQLPLPDSLKGYEKVFLSAIKGSKDVDGLSESAKEAGVVPCTPKGIMKIFERCEYSLEGKHVAVIGRSQLVGKPIAELCLKANATVTVCHSHTSNLKEITKEADVIISAVGKAGFITPDMIKTNAFCIDVGINRCEDGSIVGDISPDVIGKAGWLTPVPNGVGPMTVAMVASNFLDIPC